ncbi:MAG: lysostaphin resistance A-like protein [Halobacteriaceae archaeon]
MPAWTPFVGFVLAVTAVVVALARATAAMGDSGPVPAEIEAWTPVDLSLNVALTHGAIGAAVAGAAWFSDIPASALGLDAPAPVAVGLGVAAGAALYVLDETAAWLADRLGVPYSERLREFLTPETRGGWVVLLFVALPAVAGAEELLFRAALVGVPAAAYGVSPWLLAVPSSLLFGAAHGTQGPGGAVVAALLGFGLAATYVLTGSLLAAVVAHYLVNAAEFAGHEYVR